MATTQTVQMTEQEFREFSLSDTSSQWELVNGQLRERPWMSVEHGGVMGEVHGQLYVFLDPREFTPRMQHARLRVSSETYYIPDIAVIPVALEDALYERRGVLDAYDDPLPLVIEVWSPSTGRYDIDAKIPGYQQRGDLEIWRIHPFEHTLTAWRRQPDGGYHESVYRTGIVTAESLAGFAIDLDALLARVR